MKQPLEAKPLPGGLMRYEAPSGGHGDLVMALAIGWQGIAGHKRRALDGEFLRAIVAANDELPGGDRDRVPSDYPLGGGRKRGSI